MVLLYELTQGAARASHNPRSPRHTVGQTFGQGFYILTILSSKGTCYFLDSGLLVAEYTWIQTAKDCLSSLYSKGYVDNFSGFQFDCESYIKNVQLVQEYGRIKKKNIKAQTNGFHSGPIWLYPPK